MYNTIVEMFERLIGLLFFFVLCRLTKCYVFCHSLFSRGGVGETCGIMSDLNALFEHKKYGKIFDLWYFDSVVKTSVFVFGMLKSNTTINTRELRA